jgi:hypothetical protein
VDPVALMMAVCQFVAHVCAVQVVSTPDTPTVWFVPPKLLVLPVVIPGRGVEVFAGVDPVA